MGELDVYLLGGLQAFRGDLVDEGRQRSLQLGEADDYGCPESFADVLRHIALDERHHRDESLADLARLAAERA